MILLLHCGLLWNRRHPFAGARHHSPTQPRFVVAALLCLGRMLAGLQAAVSKALPASLAQALAVVGCTIASCMPSRHPVFVH